MTVHLTHIEGCPNSEDVCPGMAYFAGTGPAGKTCGECIHRGYRRNAHDVKKHYGCRQFRSLTGKNGPAVESWWYACKYFEPKGKR